jgi:hypothetical protein
MPIAQVTLIANLGKLTLLKPKDLNRIVIETTLSAKTEYFRLARAN